MFGKLSSIVLLLAMQPFAGLAQVTIHSHIITALDDEKLIITDNPYLISMLPPSATKDKKPDSGLSRPSSIIVFATTAIIDDSVRLKNKEGECDMSTRDDFYMAEQAKAGYFNTTTLLGKNTSNPLQPYKKIYNLPAPEPLPLKKAKGNDFYVRSVVISEKSDSTKRYGYPKYSNFELNHPKYSETDEHGRSIHEEAFSHALNKTLTSWNYIDTTKHGLAYLYDRTMYVRCNVSSISIYTVGYFTSFDVKASWKLYSPAGGIAVYEATYESSSVWGSYSSGNENFINFTTDALSRSLAKFMQEDKVKRALYDSGFAAPNQQVWDTIKLLTNDTGRVTKLSDAIKAGVTIKNSNGNGSGCIISSDGYVVTNFLVAGADTAKEVTLYTSKGDTLKATRIRNNVSYDLALLKIKKPGSYKYFFPETNTDIPLGMDVYAIGTPAEVELGQTISKGIISGQRKAGTKKIIQTDVGISPGNNGGALVNDKGALIGIVNAKYIGVGIQGIGFAIPAYYLEEALKVKFTK